MTAGEGRERELKLGVPDAAALEALIEAAGGRREPPVLQVNHFFDTPDGALRQRLIGFRVRVEGESRYILTLKGPTATTSNGMLSDRVELESEISHERADAALEGQLPVLCLLEDLGDFGMDETGLADTVRAVCEAASPVHVGSFGNERTRVVTELAGTPVVLEFDRTRFSREEERFEVELELEPGQSVEPMAEALRDLFTSAGVRAVPTTSKLARFREILERE
jgi:uncharacterized protein YjbK